MTVYRKRARYVIKLTLSEIVYNHHALRSTAAAIHADTEIATPSLDNETGYHLVLSGLLPSRHVTCIYGNLLYTPPNFTVILAGECREFSLGHAYRAFTHVRSEKKV